MTAILRRLAALVAGGTAPVDAEPAASAAARRPAQPSAELTFFHHQPKLFNVGDEMCSPKHYFDFHCEAPTLIVGGGAFQRFAMDRVARMPAEHRVAWGVGQSYVFSRTPPPVPLRQLTGFYRAVSTRDPYNEARGLPFVPCVSALHPITDLAPGGGRALVLNQGALASGDQTAAILQTWRARVPDLKVGTNALSIRALLELLAPVGEVTTNSYHVAYWSLLSGRAVRLIGYSTKFHSLLACFRLPAAALTVYERGDANSLSDAIERAERVPAVRSHSAERLKAEFRERNLAFADSLRPFGIDARRRGAAPSQGG